MVLKAPQIIYLVIVLIALLLDANLHGKPKTGYHNFFTSAIGIVLGLGLLYWGGFFG